jgi:hypothetical protein
VLPFSTRLLADFLTYRAAFLISIGPMSCSFGARLYATWAYAERANLIQEETHGSISRAVKRRIVLAQSLYAIGALLGLVNVTLGITLILMIQLNYAIGRDCPFCRGFDQALRRDARRLQREPLATQSLPPACAGLATTTRARTETSMSRRGS